MKKNKDKNKLKKISKQRDLSYIMKIGVSSLKIL